MNEAEAAVRAIVAARAGGLVDASPAITMADDMAPVDDGLPDWWHARGNRLFARPGCHRPRFLTDGAAEPPSGAVIVCAGAVAPGEVILWGEAPAVLLGRESYFPAGYFACGGGSAILIGDGARCTWNGRIDARNGGVVAIGEDGLWGSGVQVFTDDMHAIRDRDGRRLNAYGGTVAIGRHVWLGQEAMCLPDTRIGSGSVVGARSVVKGVLPPDSVCAGSPARAVRDGISWSFEDKP